ncbi:MAG TPA: M56 family metallopeptidase [Verrucomicrobiae bacterium]
MPAANPAPLTPWRWQDNGVLILAVLWGVGVLALGGLVLLQIFRFQRQLRRKAVPGSSPWQPLLDQCRQDCGVKSSVTIVATAQVQSPALFGLFRLRLLVPRGFGEGFSPQEVRYIFLHELAHVKRGDLWLNWLVTGLQVVHWFNPLIWLGFARLRADRELACDELALLRAGDQAGTAYGETVVKLLSQLTRPQAIPGLVGILEDKNQMRQRIKMIANFRRPSRWSALAVLLLSLVAAAALTDAQTEKPAPAVVKSSPLNQPAAGGITNSEISTEPADPARTVTMKITVVDAHTGRPVTGATLLSGMRLAPSHRPAIPAGADGVILMEEHLPRQIPLERIQNYQLQFSAPGYPERDVMWIADGGNVIKTLPAAYTVKLSRGITIGGRILDDAGQPLAGVAVMPWGNGYHGFHMQTGVVKFEEYPALSRNDRLAAITDARGYWHFDGCPEDLETIRLDVVRPGGGRTSFTTETDNLRLSVEAVQSISLQALRATNLVLTIPEGVTYHVKVVDISGQAVSPVRLKARGGDLQQIPTYDFTNQPDGTFQLPHWTAPQTLITATADGYASQTVILSPESAAVEKVITLQPMKPMRARVLGEKGEPVANATFESIDWRSNHQLTDWHGYSDAQGRVVWSNAPAQPISFWVATTNYPVVAVKLCGDDVEQVIRLRHGSDHEIRVKFQVLDSGSGAPLPKCDILLCKQWGRQFNLAGQTDDAGQYTLKMKVGDFQRGTVENFKIQIKAAGYQSWAEGDYYFDEGDREITVKMAKGVYARGVIRQPDGQPANDAAIYVCQSPEAAVFLNQPGRIYPRDGVQVVRTLADGLYQLESQNDTARVVVWHTSGCLQTTYGELRGTNSLQLQKFARVHGVLKIAGQPAANERVQIQGPGDWSFTEGLQLVYSAQTDAAGRFSFNDLPPLHYKLSRTPHLIMGAETVESHAWPLVLQAGEDQSVDYHFDGHRVTGRLTANSHVDWLNDNQLLVLKTPALPPPPSVWSYVNRTNYEQAKHDYYTSPAVQENLDRQQQFQLVLDKNGNFHIDDVPPGDYELRIKISRPPGPDENSWTARTDIIGSLNQPITIPAGTEPLELGNFKVTTKNAPSKLVSKGPPGQLAGLDLTGQAASLAKLKGQRVVVVFWAAWSDRSTEQLAALAKLQRDPALAGKVLWQGVNLDSALTEAQAVAKQRAYDWPQMWLDETAKARALTDFSVKNLPSIAVVGPDGTVEASELEADTVADTLKNLASEN